MLQSEVKYIVGFNRKTGKRKYKTGVVVRELQGCWEIESEGKCLRLYPSEFSIVKYGSEVSENREREHI
jgi:hypothetical protein